MIIQSTSSAMIATSRMKFQGFRRSLAARNQPTSTPPTTTPVHVYSQQHKKTPQVTITNLPFEPRPTKLPPLSRTWRFLTPPKPAAPPSLPPRLSSWNRSIHSQHSSGLPPLLPPSVPARSVQRGQLRPQALAIRKDSGRLGVRQSYSSYNTAAREGSTGQEIMTKCVYVPWLINSDSAESAEWNAFLMSNAVGHYHCQDTHC